ncbi:MAG: AraC family transcriptional regulator [Dehalococcoidia bacterium]|nr:MAG: AraC family transcriptional regulator [Dehalococcoidia bacterium]
MAIEVTVKKTEPMTVAFVSMKGPYSLIGETFGKLYGWIGEKGYVPTGPPVGVYFNAPGQVPDEELLWELRSPIAGDVAPGGPDERGLGIKKVEAAEVAATMHKGPYDQVGATYGALAGWIAENGYEIVGPSEEVYLSDPGKTAPEELLSEIRFPVKKR